MNRRHAPILLALTLGALVAAVPPFAAADPAPASPEVTAALQPYLDGYKLAGAVAVIADKTGHIHYRNLLGYADVEARRPISEDDVFWVASMSKMFVGASVMMLVDEGKLSLDDPAARHIPQLAKWMVVAEKDEGHMLLNAPARPVTIRHLLSHTSGLARSAEVQQVAGADATPLKARALASVTGPLQWEPGEKYEYGNQGINVAARIVEVVSGMPYEQFLQTRLFEPLGMTETTFWPSEAQVARMARTYGPNKSKDAFANGDVGFLTRPWGDRARRYPEAAGGLFSTTHDILRYGLLLANDGQLDGRRYLSHAAMDELRKEQTGNHSRELQSRLSPPQRPIWPRRRLRHRLVGRPQQWDGCRVHDPVQRRRPVGGARRVPQDGLARLSEMTGGRAPTRTLIAIHAFLRR